MIHAARLSTRCASSNAPVRRFLPLSIDRRDKCSAENETVFLHRIPTELPPLPEGKPLVAAVPYEGPRLAVEKVHDAVSEAAADAALLAAAAAAGSAAVGTEAD